MPEVIVKQTDDVLLPIMVAKPLEGYYVYMMTSSSNDHLYIGVTNDLVRRVKEHKRCNHDGYTKQNQLFILVYYQRFSSVEDAIAREKQLKRWSRVKKETLIEMVNPARMDLAEGID